METAWGTLDLPVRRNRGLGPRFLRVTGQAVMGEDRVTLINTAWPALRIHLLPGWLVNSPLPFLLRESRQPKHPLNPRRPWGTGVSSSALSVWGCRGSARYPGWVGHAVTPFPHPSSSGLSVLIRVRLELRRHQRARHTIPQIFQAVAQRQPERLALVDAGSGACWTFAQLDAYSNAVANFFLRLGFAPGDVVAIFMEGRPEFVGLWLGLAKAGVEAALLNVNLRREPLAFCLGTSGAKALVFGGELAAGEAGCG